MLPPKNRQAKFFAVKPVIERDSEYNRLNSSHNDSEGSQLSFRRANIETSSDSQSNNNQGSRRLKTSVTTSKLATTMQRSTSHKRVHQRNLTDTSISEHFDKNDDTLFYQ